VRSKYTVTVLDGIREVAPGVRVAHALGAAMPGEEQGADPRTLRDEAVAVAARADVAVVVVGYSYTLEAEGFDRPSMDLPAGQEELIQAVAAANANTVVVVAAGAPVTMTRWIRGVRGVLYAWYGGQEAGHAVGDLLFGLASPSGKLPVSFPARIEDSTAHGNYPGQDLKVAYAEGIYVGYRGMEKRKVAPLFPFGFGLSYTTFEYGGLRLSKLRLKKGETLEVTLPVRNSGTRAGAEVVQLYVRDVASSLDRPEKELKGFRRVALAPGETKDVTFTLDTAALSFFDPSKNDWVAEAGDFEVLVGASSRDVRLKGGFVLAE
jgi:beta-glucosidase